MNKRTINKLAITAAVFLILSACSNVKENNNYEFQTSKNSISEARQNFRKSDNNFLALLLVDHQGQVVKIKKLGSKLDDARKDLKVIKDLHDVQFSSVQPGAKEYREFILPYTVGISGSRSATDTTLNAYEPKDLLD